MQLEVSTNHGMVLLFILDMFGAFKIRNYGMVDVCSITVLNYFIFFLNIRALAPVPFHRKETSEFSYYSY
jgi:hypothetical protein